jgi:hypothetical protein
LVVKFFAMFLMEALRRRVLGFLGKFRVLSK